jgi:ribosomal protein S18 acetylase RimI-like enzyme
MNHERQPSEAGGGGRKSVRIFCHGRTAPALRLGLDPALRPVKAMEQLRHLLIRNAFWCQGRSPDDLRRMLKQSAVCVTAWRGRQLVGFGRATSDGIFRGTIWDVVVDATTTGQGIGKTIVTTLLAHPDLANCERIYLMTTNSSKFYQNIGFHQASTQVLMVKEKSG